MAQNRNVKKQFKEDYNQPIIGGVSENSKNIDNFDDNFAENNTFFNQEVDNIISNKDNVYSPWEDIRILTSKKLDEQDK